MPTEKQQEYQRDYYDRNREKRLAYQREYRNANPELVKKRKQDYYARNKEAIKSRVKEYREANLEAVKVRNKDYYARNRATISDKGKAYRDRNKAALSARRRSYYLRNKEAHNEYCREYSARNRDHLRAYIQDYLLRRAYSISAADKQALLVAQGGGCGICGTDYPGKIGWHTDHDHHTGEVRGILCLLCNLGVGQFNDDPALLRAAAEYLRRKGYTPEPRPSAPPTEIDSVSPDSGRAIQLELFPA